MNSSFDLIAGVPQWDVLPIWELKFRDLPEQSHRIATQKVKYDPKYRRKYRITSCEATDLSDSEQDRIKKLCRRVYRILGLNGYARMDLRLSEETGKIYLLEANPNPHIGKEEDFAQSARKTGIDYPDLLNKILHLGMRWQPQNLAG